MITEPGLDAVHARYPPVDDRVALILENIRRDCRELGGERRNEGNERQVEEFIARRRAEFGDTPRLVIERQRLSAWAVRTTRWNYLFTVPGESADRIVLVAHYDTWRGPGADDNTTGEEILKQCLLTDLRAARRPALTHTYFLAGSEECGLVGLTSQLLLALGLQAANLALTQQNWLWAAVAVALAPLAGYRFGVSGSREYVKTLSMDDLRRIRGVVSVDSVGEGRLYIPRGTLGADFLHVLIPFGDYDSINDLLEEAAHLHGIKYNNYLAGGTTDHVSFLEVNNGLWARLRESLRRPARETSVHAAGPRARDRARRDGPPGKASPIVFGGKIHTPRDTPDRVYPGPLRETLLILDYFFHRLDGGARVGHPRYLDEFHYARLYRTNGGHLLALKDAVEHNRRNVNGVYRVTADVRGKRAVATVQALVGWGVETRLRDQVAETSAQLGLTWERERIDELAVAGGDVRLYFARRLTPLQRLSKASHRVIAALQAVVRNGIVLTFFALAWVLAQAYGWALDASFDLSPRFALWVATHTVLTLVAIVTIEIAILSYMMARRIPTWIDNAYQHENRADNLESLRRIRLQGAEQATARRTDAQR